MFPRFRLMLYSVTPLRQSGQHLVLWKSLYAIWPQGIRFSLVWYRIRSAMSCGAPLRPILMTSSKKFRFAEVSCTLSKACDMSIIFFQCTYILYVTHLPTFFHGYLMFPGSSLFSPHTRAQTPFNGPVDIISALQTS